MFLLLNHSVNYGPLNMLWGAFTYDVHYFEENLSCKAPTEGEGGLNTLLFH